MKGLDLVQLGPWILLLTHHVLHTPIKDLEKEIELGLTKPIDILLVSPRISNGHPPERLNFDWAQTRPKFSFTSHTTIFGISLLYKKQQWAHPAAQ